MDPVTTHGGGQFQSERLFPNVNNVVYNMMLWNETESLGLVVSHVTVATHSMSNVKQLILVHVTSVVMMSRIPIFT